MGSNAIGFHVLLWCHSNNISITTVFVVAALFILEAKYLIIGRFHPRQTGQLVFWLLTMLAALIYCMLMLWFDWTVVSVLLT